MDQQKCPGSGPEEANEHGGAARKGAIIAAGAHGLRGFLLVAGVAVLTAACDGGGSLPVYRSIAELRFPDPILQACVRRFAEKRSWQQAGEVVALRCNNPGRDAIRSLEGIDQLPNLARANFAHNRISDARPLIGLDHLSDLDLGYNVLPGLSSDRPHLGLARVNLDHNRVRDLGWLRYFGQLEILSLGHNRIEDLAPLKWVPRLGDLNLEYNRISRLGALRGLVGLRLLDVSGNVIDSLDAVAGHPGLEVLVADDNSITTVGAVRRLQTLDELSLAGNPLSDISALGGLTKLRRLVLDDTPIRDLAPLAVLGNLQSVSLRRVAEPSCAALEHLAAELGGGVVHTGARCPGLR